VPFVFQTLRAVHGDAVSARDRAMAERIQRYFVSFVKSGNPNSPGLLPWQKHDRSKRALMLFGAEGPRMQRDPWQARLDLIERAANR
jgi:para-nitrobenzyl esterase